MTLYAADLEGNGLLDTITKIHCFGFKPVGKSIIYVFCRINELDLQKRRQFEENNIQFFELDQAVDLLNSSKTGGFTWQNFLGYDGEVIKKFYDLDYNWKSFNNRDIILNDTLVESIYLHPDRQLPKGCPSSIKYIDVDGKEKTKRIGPHSLEAWGYRTGISKPQVVDWRTQPLHVYVNRVVEDCKIQEATYLALQKEKQDVAIPNGSKIGNWEIPLKMAHKNYYLMQEQERTGVCFDAEGAKKLIIRIDKEMKEIEDEVEPILGMRELPQGQQPKFPSNYFKKAFDYKAPWTTTGKLKKQVKDYLNKIFIMGEKRQENYIKNLIIKRTIEGVDIYDNYIEDVIPKHKSLLTSHALSYCKKFEIGNGYRVFQEIKKIIRGRKKEKKLVEKLRLSHKKDVKDFLIREGWIPTIWKFRNILVDPKTKMKLSKKEIGVKLDKYLKEFYESGYWPFILEELGLKVGDDVDITSERFRKTCIKKGRNLLSSPQYTDQRGDLCPNLNKLDGESAKKICRWLSLQNRRNTIESPPSASKKKWTGWLHNPRLKIDGRLPASSSGITNTNRQKHSVVVNVPKPKDHVILGKEMRGLFIPRNNYYFIGGDGQGLEARVTAHYTWSFDNGAYAKLVLEGDFHTTMAKAYTDAAGFEINRDDGKNATYAITYSVQAQKLSKMLSVSPEVAQKIIDAFYEVNYGLALNKEAVIKYWEATGKKYIMTIDGRKIFVRSPHSAQNALFQSTGAIIMDFACCWLHDQIKKENLDFYRTLYVHDEIQGEQNKEEVEISITDATLEEDLPKDENGKPIRKKDPLKPSTVVNDKIYSVPKFVNNKWISCYSRAGELICKGIEAAGRYYKMNLPFPGEYMVSKQGWSGTH